jgi:glycosyltransferase involved in cell wall biosynthesis
MAKDRPPQLTIVTLTLDIGGTERHIAQIAPKLAQDGFDVTVICLGRPGVQADAVRQQGVRVVGPVAGSRKFNTSRHGTALALSTSIPVLAKELAMHRPDIAHFFLPLPYLVGAPLARLVRVPHLVMSRRSQNDYQMKRPRLARREHRLHRHMSLILANSGRVYSQLIGEGADPAKTGIITNGLDLSAFDVHFDRKAARWRLDIADNALVLAIAANLIPYKGHADLLAALGLVQASLPQGWRLLVIGRDDGLGPSLLSHAQSLGIAQNILWLGERRDVPDLLHLADIGLNVSHEEGFSNAVIESLAAGLPMLVTDVGGNAEAVPEGVAGLVVPAKAPEALARALVRLATDPALRARMGEAARARAACLYGLESCVRHYLLAYRALLSGQAMPNEIDPRLMRLASGARTG